MSLQTRIAALISAIGADVKSLYAHAASTVNPHAVTKLQVGLGNVDNTSDAAKNAAVATLTNKTLVGAVLTDATLPVATNNYPAAVPALNLNFEHGPAIDPRITFTRASAATYFGADGIMRTAPAGVMRRSLNPVTGRMGFLVEETRTNLLPYSQDLDNAAWSKTRAVVVPNAALAPDGTMTADKLRVDTTSATDHYAASGVVMLTAGTTYTYSVFAKAAEKSYLTMWVTDGAFASGTQAARYNLANCTVVGTQAGLGILSITPAGKGWCRCSITVTPTASANVAFLLMLSESGTNSMVGDGTSGVYLWGAQFEAGNSATSYIRSNTVFSSRASVATFVGSNGLIQYAPADTPRYQYNPDNLALDPVLLLEAAGTNLLGYSNDFSNAIWAKAQASIMPNIALAPDGTMTADKLVEDTTTNFHNFYRNSGMTAGATYTQSIYLRASERTKCHLLFYTDTTYYGVLVDLLAGTISAPNVGGVLSCLATSVIASVGGGWYRVSSTCAMIGTTHQMSVRLYTTSDTYTGNGTYGICVWEGQLETGAYATSTIPAPTAATTRAADVSTSGAATRAADVADMTGGNFSSWYRQDEGTFVVDYECAMGSAFYPSAWFVSANYNNRMGHSMSAGLKTCNYDALTNGVGDFYLGHASTSDAVVSAFTYAKNNVASSANSSAVVFDNISASIPPASTLHIGHRMANAQLNGHIHSLRYFPARLSNAQVQALSTL